MVEARCVPFVTINREYEWDGIVHERGRPGHLQHGTSIGRVLTLDMCDHEGARNISAQRRSIARDVLVLALVDRRRVSVFRGFGAAKRVVEARLFPVNILAKDVAPNAPLCAI